MFDVSSTRALGKCWDLHARKNLIGFDCSLKIAAKEFRKRNVSYSIAAAQLYGCVKRQQCGRQIGAGLVVAKVAADGAQVSDRCRTNFGSRLRKYRRSIL